MRRLAILVITVALLATGCHRQAVSLPRAAGVRLGQWVTVSDSQGRTAVRPLDQLLKTLEGATPVAADGAPAVGPDHYDLDLAFHDGDALTAKHIYGTVSGDQVYLSWPRLFGGPVYVVAREALESWAPVLYPRGIEQGVPMSAMEEVLRLTPKAESPTTFHVRGRSAEYLMVYNFRPGYEIVLTDASQTGQGSFKFLYDLRALPGNLVSRSSTYPGTEFTAPPGAAFEVYLDGELVPTVELSVLQ